MKKKCKCEDKNTNYHLMVCCAMEEQHESEMTQEEKDAQEWMNASMGKPSKYVHYAIQVEPNNTIGLYKDGKSVKSIDFWILDGRADK